MNKNNNDFPIFPALFIGLSFIIFLFFSYYNDFKDYHLNDYFFGRYSDDNYKDHYKKINIESLNLKKYKEWFKEEQCNYNFEISSKYKSYNTSTYKNEFIFETKCYDKNKNFFVESVLESEENYKNFSATYFFKYDETYADNNSLKNYSKNDLKEAFNDENAKNFIRLLTEILDEKELERLQRNEKMNSWIE